MRSNNLKSKRPECKENLQFIRWGKDSCALFCSRFLSIVAECGQAPVDRSGEFIHLKYYGFKVRIKSKSCGAPTELMLHIVNYTTNRTLLRSFNICGILQMYRTYGAHTLNCRLNYKQDAPKELECLRDITNVSHLRSSYS